MTDSIDLSPLRLGVVSDTHGNVPNTLSAVRLLESLDVQIVLHCGDIGTPEIVRLFHRWPTHFVFGNCDDAPTLRLAISAAGQTCHERWGTLELVGRRIALLHSDDYRQFDFAQHSGLFDLVCYGHTHQADLKQLGHTRVLNPGALHRANPHSLAIVDLPALQITNVPL